MFVVTSETLAMAGNIKVLLLRGRETIAEHRPINNYTSQSGGIQSTIQKCIPFLYCTFNVIVKLEHFNDLYFYHLW